MAGFSRSANGQGHVASDGPNSHVPLSCLEVVVAAENVTSVVEENMNGRSEPSFESGMSRVTEDSLHAGVLSGGYVGVAVCVFYGVTVGVARVSSTVLRTPSLSVAWRLA